MLTLSTIIVYLFQNIFLFRPGHEIVGKVHVKQIYEIALVKQRDEHLKRIPLDALCRTIAASAKSMGLEVVRS